MDKEQLVIIENTPFINYIINTKFPNYKYKEDLFQVGSIGLLKAYRKYDSSLDCKLTSYAYTFILGEMLKLVREDKSIKISRKITSLNLKIEKANVLLSQRLMHKPSIEELSEFLDVPTTYINEAINSNNCIVSIDDIVTSNGKVITYHDLIKDPNEMDVDSLIALKEELSSLTPFEKSLIETRYMHDFTQSETASSLGINQVQVSRKEQKILSKLNKSLTI